MTRTFNLLLGSKTEFGFVVLTVGILLVLFTPIPAGMLDLLLIANLSFALTIFLLTFYIDKPLSFSTFPSLLLIATLFRLALNISATRLILSEAEAGKVIGAIGSYVIQGNYIVGLVVFLILIVVQFIVVTNGAQRVAEVAARFTLDSLPGKQMSIDAELNLGLIDHTEARKKRQALEKETNFYGAMDGASKFVKGDAIAGIIIILIDIVAGLSVGLSQHNMSWGQALHTYTLLTVGDGIITQIPALIISTATGVIVTRAATDAQLGTEITRQISAYPKILVMVSLGLMGMMLLPGVPALPVVIIFSLFVILAFIAFRLFIKNEKLNENQIESEENLKENEKQNKSNLKERELIYQTIKVEPISILIAADLIDFIGGMNDPFMERIATFRKNYAKESGFILPQVKIKDDIKLAQQSYAIYFQDALIAKGMIQKDHHLAINPGNAKQDLKGKKPKIQPINYLPFGLKKKL